MRHMFKCKNCGKYTMKEICSCGGAAVVPRPAKYSPLDKFANYRRQAKIDEYKSRGMI